MKKFFLLVVCVLSIGLKANSQGTLLEILDAIATGVVDYQNANRLTLQNFGTITIEVNSTSNAFFYGGHTRNYIEFEVPAGTVKWFYRATVMPIASNYQYEANESFYYLLTNNQNVDLYNPTSYGVDILFFDHSGEINTFYTGGSGYKSYQNLNKWGSRTTTGTVSFYRPKMYIGVENKNSTEGLKVIFEIVGYGNYQ